MSVTTNIATRVSSMFPNSANPWSAISKLASGSNIVNASDNPAGLAIATQLQGNLTALGQAGTNAAQGSAILQTASGGLSAIGGVLQRMMTLATQAASGNVTDAQRGDIQTEFANLGTEINQIAGQTSFGGQSLLNGTGPFAGGVNFTVGAQASDTVSVKLGNATTGAGGLNITGNVSTAANAQAMMSTVSQAIGTLTQMQASIGASQSQFNAVSQSIGTTADNVDAAASSITAADVALQKVAMTTSDVKAQARIAALTQANKMSQHVINLLKS
ncbi:MAG: flagellin [Magnetospirillum sp.]|nr:flagellin [Magnetospirillum sp.]